jgi:polysaccharide biosynthesis protein PslG
MSRRILIPLLLAVALATAAADATATPRSFFGTISFSDPTKAEFDRMGRARVGTYRTNFVWSAVEPSGPNSSFPDDWSRYDKLIGDAAANGIRVLPTVYGSPQWAASKTTSPPDQAHRADFSSFLHAAVQRYGPDGQFWTDPSLYQTLHPGKKAVPIHIWQIWNEPNSPAFWSPKPSPAAYADLLRAANAGIHSADRSATVLTAGLVGNPNIRNGIRMVKYLGKLYEIGCRKLFDAVSVHPYTRTPRKALGTLEDARRVMNEHKDKRARLWITEVGWATSGERTSLTVGRKRQARYLRQMFMLAARSRKRDHIGGVVWFSFKDQQNPLWFYRTGMFTVDGRAKPSWKAFVRLTGGKP